MMPRPTTVSNVYALVAVITIIAKVATASYSRTLTEILGNFDTLKKEHITHAPVKRSINSIAFGEKALHFQSLGRKFSLKLTPDRTIFSPDFVAVVVDDDKEVEIIIDKDDFLTGYLEGDFDSKVQAHLENGILTANIQSHDEVYVVEPSSRHVNGSHDFDMIVYKVADVKSNLTNPGKLSDSHASFCGVKDQEKEHKPTYEHNPDLDDMRKRREKRSTPTTSSLDTCQLALVADHLFFQHMGLGTSSTAINYMLSVLQRVDQIYRSTIWGGNLKNIGFEVRKVIVHDKPSGSKGPKYNQYKAKPWSEEKLLVEFSKSNWKDFCLSHLFTYQDFPNGVLGIAYVGSPKFDQGGGICSPEYKGGDMLSTFLNIGLSSSMNSGRRLLTSEADVVTSHELGHNFGSNHDPLTGECSPSESKGGKYMMHRTSVTGLKYNNKRFSPCSLRSIFKVLVAKRHICFKSRVGQYCGNFEVEENKRVPANSEQCDPGVKVQLNIADKCCANNCKFKSGAVCSDSNMPCCDSCQFAKKTKKCRERFSLACQGETFCNGSSAACPEAPLLSGVPCSFSKGVCFGGVCKTLCQQYQKTSCICSDSESKCKICCKKQNSTEACTAIIVNGTKHNLNDGGPCDAGSYSGSCQQGKCKKTQINVFDKFLSLLQDFTASKFARFMQENIVGTILVFSLFVWIPGSCIVHYVDKRREREVLNRMNWEDAQNTDLIRRNNKNKNKNVFKAAATKNPKSPLKKKAAKEPHSDTGLEVRDSKEVSM